MICPNCGNEGGNGKFCSNCGSPLTQETQANTSWQDNGQQGYEQQGYQQQGYQQQNYQQNYQPAMYFDGEGGDYLVMMIINALMLIFTLGFAYPWVVCRNLKWRKEHTVLDGHRLAFTGRAEDLLVNWIKWWILSAITCGIYSLWVGVRIREWEMSHTCFAEDYQAPGTTFNDCFYDGSVEERLGHQIITTLVTIVTCGLAAPWARVRLIQYDSDHTVIHGMRLGFVGTGMDYWIEGIIIQIFTFLTCGIYNAWGICRINRWVCSNTIIQSVNNVKRTNY